MRQQLRFLHVADLHLGAPFRGLRALSEEWAERLTRAIPEAFDRAIDAALRENVDFVVIAGDVFDTNKPSYAHFTQFFQGLERLSAAGIPVYLCTGNHDPYVSWKSSFFALPENVTMFAADAPSFALYERGGQPLCVLGGRGYPFKVWSADDDISAGLTRAAAEEVLGPRASEAPFGVGVLHTGLHLDTAKAPTDPTALRRAGFDYWALGHIHKHWADDAQNPRLVFSGCIQGRDIRETKRRGVTLVTLTEGMPNRIEFIPTASVVWQQLEVDVSSCAGLPDAISLILRELFRVNGAALCEEMISRVTLVGATELHEDLARPGVLEDMRQILNGQCEFFFCDAILDCTTMPLDRDVLLREGMFPAAFLRSSERLRADRAAINRLLQDELFRRDVDPMSIPTRKLDDLAQEAESLVLDLLLRGDAR